VPFYLSPGWLRLDPTFDPLRNDPRFKRLLEGWPAPRSPAAPATAGRSRSGTGVVHRQRSTGHRERPGAVLPPKWHAGGQLLLGDAPVV